MTTIPLHGKWCLGHGLPDQAPSLRPGHYVQAHLVDDCFSTRNGSKGFAPNRLTATLEPRCAICRSIIRWHDHHANAVRRAKQWRRQHAERWVKKERHPTITAALQEMDTGGVTVEALAALLLEQIGEPCPGLCAHEDDGQIIVHTIDTVADMHIDVRDPTHPFSIENIGILCSSCNQAKRDMPWAQFIYKRRAHVRAWIAAMKWPEYRRPEQGTLF